MTEISSPPWPSSFVADIEAPRHRVVAECHFFGVGTRASLRRNRCGLGSPRSHLAAHGTKRVPLPLAPAAAQDSQKQTDRRCGTVLPFSKGLLAWHAGFAEPWVWVWLHPLVRVRKGVPVPYPAHLDPALAMVIEANLASSRCQRSQAGVDCLPRPLVGGRRRCSIAGDPLQVSVCVFEYTQ